MAKLKKLGIWSFGIVLALAFLVYQLVQLLAGYALKPANAYFQDLVVANNTLMINIIQWGLIIIISFVFGVILAILYNLVSKWIGIKMEMTEKKR